MKSYAETGGAVRDRRLGGVRECRLLLQGGKLICLGVKVEQTSEGWFWCLTHGPVRCAPVKHVVRRFCFGLCNRYIGPQVENTVKQLLYMAGNKDIRGSYPWGTQRLQGLHGSGLGSPVHEYTCEVLLFGHPIVSPWYITLYSYYIMVYYGIL